MRIPPFRKALVQACWDEPRPAYNDRLIQICTTHRLYQL